MVTSPLIRAIRRDFARQFTHATCTIRADDGTETFNAGTGVYSTGDGTEVYAGGCLVSRASADARVAELAGETIEASAVLVRVPVTVTGVSPGHTVSIDTSADSDLTGRLLRVKFVGRFDWTANRPLLCEELE